MDFLEIAGILFTGVFVFCGIKTFFVFIRSCDDKNEEHHEAYAEKIKNWSAAGIAAGVVLLVLAVWPT